MLSSDFVLVLLQASITGAGLILAVYALIVPVSRRIFGYRVEAIYDELAEFRKKIRQLGEEVGELGSGLPRETFEEVTELVKSIEARGEFPWYLSWGAAISFSGYVLSSLISVGWIVDYQSQRPAMDTYLGPVFVGSTLLFLLVGILSIKDISETMKREFDELKKRAERAKQTAEALEAISIEVEDIKTQLEKQKELLKKQRKRA